MKRSLSYICQDGESKIEIVQEIRGNDLQGAFGSLRKKIRKHRQATKPVPTPQKKSYRAILFDRQQGRCHWCGVPCHLDKEVDDTQATKDHLTPQCEGGSNGIKNLVMACRKCNLMRGHTGNPLPTPLGLSYDHITKRPVLNPQQEATAQEFLRRYLANSQQRPERP